MHRFYLPPSECQRTTLTLTEREAHHAAQVLRARPGDSAITLDGAGHEFICEVQAVSRKAVSLSVKSKNFTPLPLHQITLLQAVPKGKIIESIIQKATELGVARIVPLLSERVITQLDGENSADKTEKWRMTAVEAIKQCGQVWLPRIAAPVTPKTFLAQKEKFDLAFVAALQQKSRHPRGYFESFRGEKKTQPKSVAIWVGPEGDFTSEELEEIQRGGALPITLGRLVLRCETAAIYCLSVLNYELTGECAF